MVKARLGLASPIASHGLNHQLPLGASTRVAIWGGGVALSDTLPCNSAELLLFLPGLRRGGCRHLRLHSARKCPSRDHDALCMEEPPLLAFQQDLVS